MKQFYSITKAFLPILTFLAVFAGTSLYGLFIEHPTLSFKISPLAAVFISLVVALFLNLKNMTTILDHIVDGMREKNIITMCLIYLLAGAFSAVSVMIGSVEATVSLCLYFIPGFFIVPGLFLIAAIIGTAMGTSMGTIAALGPIALGVANQTGLPLPLAMGTIVSGAMCGDNISMISDTTIAAVQSIGANLRKKFNLNFKLILPVILFTMAGYYFAAPNVIHDPSDALTAHWSLTIPYFLVFTSALLGVNVFVVLISGILAGGVIGLCFGLNTMDYFQAINGGFMNMSEILILSLIIAGIGHLLHVQGGVHWLIKKIKVISGFFIRKKKDSRAGALSIAFLSSVCDICVANNTIAILLAKDAAASIGDEYKLNKNYTATLLDIFSCAFQGILPYAPQLLLAASIAHISPFQIMPYVFFCYGMIIWISISILIKSKK